MIIAAAVLIIGVVAMAGLVGVAVASNGHNKLDSSATMLAQAVTEQVYTGISNLPYNGNGQTTMLDCAGNSWTLDTEAPTNLSDQSALKSDGTIDFSSTQPKWPNYHMDYVVCAGNVKTTYDVRWNITPLSGNAYTSMLTVGVQMEGGATGIVNFPINIRVMVGKDQ